MQWLLEAAEAMGKEAVPGESGTNGKLQKLEACNLPKLLRQQCYYYASFTDGKTAKKVQVPSPDNTAIKMAELDSNTDSPPQTVRL